MRRIKLIFLAFNKTLDKRIIDCKWQVKPCAEADPPVRNDTRVNVKSVIDQIAADANIDYLVLIVAENFLSIPDGLLTSPQATKSGKWSIPTVLSSSVLERYKIAFPVLLVL